MFTKVMAFLIILYIISIKFKIIILCNDLQVFSILVSLIAIFVIIAKIEKTAKDNFEKSKKKYEIIDTNIY